MESRIQPPKGFFGSAVESVNEIDDDSSFRDDGKSKGLRFSNSESKQDIVTLEEESTKLGASRDNSTPSTTGSRFKFGGPSRKTPKKVGIESEILVAPSVSNGQSQIKTEEKLVFLLHSFIKIPYSNVPLKKLRFDESTKKSVNWGDMMAHSQANKVKEQQLTEKQIQENTASEQIFDLFGGATPEHIVRERERENDTTGETASKINEYLSIISSNEVSGKKEKVTPKGFIAIETFFTNVFKLVEFLNAEERGRFLIHCIFGCLISRAKFMGAGAKSGTNKFKDLTSALSKLTTGGSATVNSKVYSGLIGVCSGPKLNKYRSEVSAGDQVTFMVDLINKISAAKYPVFFPLNLQFSDPVAIYTGVAPRLVLDVKTVPLSRTPTLDNLNDYFGVTAAKAKSAVTQSKRKSDDDEYGDDYGDLQDNVGRGGRGSEWQTDDRSGGGAGRDKKMNKW